MASKDEIIDTLLGIIIGGRAGFGPGMGGQNPYLDIPSFGQALAEDRARAASKKKTKRVASKSQKKYGLSFKRLAPKFKKKNGSWKKDGFKR